MARASPNARTRHACRRSVRAGRAGRRKIYDQPGSRVNPTPPRQAKIWAGRP